MGPSNTQMMNSFHGNMLVSQNEQRAEQNEEIIKKANAGNYGVKCSPLEISYISTEPYI